MNHLFNRWLLLFVLLLGLSALACNLPFGAEETPTPRPATEDDEGDSGSSAEPTPEDQPVEVDEATPLAETTDSEPDEAETAVPSETATAEPEDDSLLGGLFAETLIVRDTVQELETLNSYQMEMIFSTTISETTQQVEATILVSTDPPQSQMNFSLTGFEELDGMNSLTMTQIEGTSYMEVPQLGCISSADTDLPEETFGVLDANEFLENVGEATLVGEENVNGVETLHYTFDETAVADGLTDFNWAQGNAYIAKEGNYVVRLTLEGEGPVENLGISPDDAAGETAEPAIGLIQIEINLLNVNEPVEIAIPDACANAGLADSEFPVLEDAYESNSFGGIVTYKTNTAFADAVSFYQESLAADGWIYAEGESFIADQTALMFFNKDGRSLTVTVTEDSESDAFLVVIFEE